MLQSKDKKPVEKLKNIFPVQKKLVDTLADLLRFFDFKNIYKQLNLVRKRGDAMSSVFSVFTHEMFLPEQWALQVFFQSSKLY